VLLRHIFLKVNKGQRRVHSCYVLHTFPNFSESFRVKRLLPRCLTVPKMAAHLVLFKKYISISDSIEIWDLGSSSVSCLYCSKVFAFYSWLSVNCLCKLGFLLSRVLRCSFFNTPSRPVYLGDSQAPDKMCHVQNKVLLWKSCKRNHKLLKWEMSFSEMPDKGGRCTFLTF
jgi:hypothetical protein